jgi:hypothetical protein
MDGICEIQNEADACMCLWLAIGNSGQYSDRLSGLVERGTIANRLANEVSRWSKFDITRGWFYYYTYTCVHPELPLKSNKWRTT